MTEYVIVATFHDSSAAYEAASAVKRLRLTAAGNVRVKTGAIVQKDDSGHIHLLEEKGHLLLDTVVGTLTGALIGLIAGAAGAAVGAALGAIVGATTDMTGSGLDADFVESVKAQMTAGTTTIIIEADEKSTRPIDDIVASEGGQLFRQEVKWPLQNLTLDA